MNTLLYWLTNRLPCRIISDDGTPYLERYYICTLFGVRFYLHRFVGSDPARGLHDHPWAWARSIVLSGWYFEERRDGKLHKVRWFNKLTGDTFHRVILPKHDVWVTTHYEHGNVTSSSQWVRCDQPCWTLFFHAAEYSKPWGFLKMRDSTGMGYWKPWNWPSNGMGSSKPWWLKAPKGRDEPRRAGKGGAA